MKMTNDDDNDHDDFSVWKLYTQDIKPIERYEPEEKEQKKPVVEKQITKPTNLEQFEADISLRSFVPQFPAVIEAQIDKRTAQRLKRGQIPIDARIDLHGMYQKDARAALTRFLLGAYAQGFRCILVVTGKGKLVLEGESVNENTPGKIKRNFKSWLAEEPLASIVLKAQVAQIKDGGEGAYYVLIRRKR